MVDHGLIIIFPINMGLGTEDGHPNFRRSKIDFVRCSRFSRCIEGFLGPRATVRPKPGRMVRFGLWSVSREEALFNRLVNSCQVVAQTFDFATATDDALLNLKWKNWSKHLRNLKSKPEPSEMLRCSGFSSQESQKGSLKK